MVVERDLGFDVDFFFFQFGNTHASRRARRKFDGVLINVATSSHVKGAFAFKLLLSDEMKKNKSTTHYKSQCCKVLNTRPTKQEQRKYNNLYIKNCIALSINAFPISSCN